MAESVYALLDADGAVRTLVVGTPEWAATVTPAPVDVTTGERPVVGQVWDGTAWLAPPLVESDAPSQPAGLSAADEDLLQTALSPFGSLSDKLDAVLALLTVDRLREPE